MRGFARSVTLIAQVSTNGVMTGSSRRREKEVQLHDGAYYLINPGTVGEPRTFDRRASYMILDLALRTVTLRHVDYNARRSAATLS